MKKPPRLIRNTPEEEAAIRRGIDADPDTFEPTDEQFAQMKRRAARVAQDSPRVISVTPDADQSELVVSPLQIPLKEAP